MLHPSYSARRPIIWRHIYYAERIFQSAVCFEHLQCLKFEAWSVTVRLGAWVVADVSVCRPPIAAGTLPGHRDSVWRRTIRLSRWITCLCESANGSISRHAALCFLTHVSRQRSAPPPVIMVLSVPCRAVPCRRPTVSTELQKVIDILTSLAIFTVRKINKKYAHFHIPSLNLIRL